MDMVYLDLTTCYKPSTIAYRNLDEAGYTEMQSGINVPMDYSGNSLLLI
jgi:hypothetical protein